MKENPHGPDKNKLLIERIKRAFHQLVSRAIKRDSESNVSAEPVCTRDLILKTLEELSTETIVQEQKEIVVENVRNLFSSSIDRLPDFEPSGINHGESQFLYDDVDVFPAVEREITIIYNTDSGKIMPHTGTQFEGDFSYYRTSIIVRRENLYFSKFTDRWEKDWKSHPTYTILLEYPKNGLSLPEWTEVSNSGLSENDEGVLEPSEEFRPLNDRTIRPERMGAFVRDLRRVSPEDKLVLKSCEVFNHLYGEKIT